MAKKNTKKQKKIETVMHEFKEGKLHSGNKKGPLVKSKQQAIAIAISESKKPGKKTQVRGKNRAPIRPKRKK